MKEYSSIPDRIDEKIETDAEELQRSFYDGLNILRSIIFFNYQN